MERRELSFSPVGTQQIRAPRRSQKEGEDWAPRWVPGLSTIARNLGFYRPATPENVYAIEERSESGIVGTVHPDGSFVSLQTLTPEYRTLYWDDACACRVAGVVVWNGSAKGGLERTLEDGVVALRRTYDGTLLGDWPINAPRAEKQVNPERARIVAAMEAAEHGDLQ